MAQQAKQCCLESEVIHMIYKQETKKQRDLEYLLLFVGFTIVIMVAFPEQLQWIEHLLHQVGIM
jgi:hypothetical protein